MKAKPVYNIPKRICLQRAVLRSLFRGIFHLISSVKIHGTENIIRSGAYLIAANHISIVEPPLVLSFWPRAPEAIGAIEIWSRPGQSILVRLYGTIPAHRKKIDRHLMDTMINVLKSGYPLLIFPEGGRSHRPGLQRALPGAAQVVDATGVPVIPVGIVGSTENFIERGFSGRRPEIHMHIGAPFHLPPIEGKGAARRAARQHNVDRIMLRIAELLPPEYHGVYAHGIPEHDPPLEERPAANDA
jgi:1-acyl-sn-glycerol-3-phosphate acyltransferase